MTIKTKPATAEYRDGYDRVFCKPQPLSEEAAIVDRVAEAMLVGVNGQPWPVRPMAAKRYRPVNSKQENQTPIRKDMDAPGMY